MAISKQQSVKAKPAKMGVVSRKLSKYAPPRRDDTKAKPVSANDCINIENFQYVIVEL